MVAAARVEEDLQQNPFLRVLRSSFEGLYQHAAERGDATTVLVPCAECLDGDCFNQVFMETHVLQAATTPGCFMNMLGQGVDVQETSVSTDLGFSEHRCCEILQTESMYDFSNTFCVLVLDKPLVGRYKSASSRPGAGGGGNQDGGGGRSASSAATGSGPAIPWLNQAPNIEDEFYDQLLHFRKTFVQVPGCENSTAERIREIVADTAKKLTKYHDLHQPTQQRQLDYQVSRNAYALLHSFVFPHLQRILAPAERRLDRAIRGFESAEDLLAYVPGAAGRGLGRVDVGRCAAHLAAMDKEITPHEKIACINEAHASLQKCIADGARASAAAAAANAAAGGLGGSARAGEPAAVEITGDDVLALFIMALRESSTKDRLAQVAYVEMYLQGAAGRSGSSEAARFEEAGYAVSALQAALQFFLDEHRSASGARGAANTGAGTWSAGGAGVGVSSFADGEARR
eukprot:TRINITY_DN38191_c0_g1_i1.p1 TRINITY_DN38191_c0_g1~~TRINITY_DN38191_c0_g1_i1.p1  ORF type:complete len:482 (+),score=116.55 TRINITY_DN38191_c0_g1_i1:70-1446(+)